MERLRAVQGHQRRCGDTRAEGARILTEHARPLTALVVAAVACFLAAWTLLPAPTYSLLTLGVGAPEVGAWIGVLGAVGLVLALSGGRPSTTDWLAAALAVAAVLLAVHPLVRLPATARRFDVAMEESLGRDYLAGVPASVRAAMRPRPLVVRDLFLGVRPGESVVQRDIPVASRGGVSLTADVYRPAGTRPAGARYPVIVQVYGGAWQRGAPAKDPLFASYLAARGYVVVAIDYRHAPAWRFPVPLEDVRAMLAWTRAHVIEHGGDASRMVLLGRSAGGHLAMLAAYARAGDEPAPAAVVSFYGPADLVGGWREPPIPDPMDARLLEETLIGGSPDARPDAYREASPITYAGRPQPPTLLVYGGRDHVVEARWARALHAALRSAGNTSVLLEIPWAEHAFDVIPQGPSGQLAMYHTERFIAWALARR